MNKTRSILIILITTLLCIILNFYNSEGKWLDPAYFFNISIYPPFTNTSDSYNLYPWSQGFYLFEGMHVPFYLGAKNSYSLSQTYPLTKNEYQYKNTLEDSNDLDTNVILNHNPPSISSPTMQALSSKHGHLSINPAKDLFFDNLLVRPGIDSFSEKPEYAFTIQNNLLMICSGELLWPQDYLSPLTIYTLKIIDLADPNGYNPIGSLQFESESGGYEKEKVKKLLYNKNLLYVLIDDPAGIYIIDVSNAETPELINFIELDFIIAQDMEIIKDWAFISFYDYDSLISSWDISDPQQFIMKDYILLDGFIQDIFICEEILVTIGNSQSGLNTIDISRPQDLELLDHIDLTGEAVWMIGGGILTSGGDYNDLSRLRVLDYKNLEGPVEITDLNLLGKEEKLCAADNIIYALTYSSLNDISRLYSFSLDEITLKIGLENTTKIEGHCQNLFVNSGYLAAQLDNHICLWDISLPASPKELSPIPVVFSEKLAYPYKRQNSTPDNTAFTSDGIAFENDTKDSINLSKPVFSYRGKLPLFLEPSMWSPNSLWMPSYFDFHETAFTLNPFSSSPIFDFLANLAPNT